MQDKHNYHVAVVSCGQRMFMLVALTMVNM